jgi:hypothetical protein
MTLLPLTERQMARDELTIFARDIVREVCVRAHSHSPNGKDEKRQATEGPCLPMALDAVKKALGFTT